MFLVLLLAALASGDQQRPSEPQIGAVPPPIIAVPNGERVFSPREAIFAAADAAPRTVPGTFVMAVAASGRARDRFYLNSELNYRDQRNLTINISPAAASELAHRYG